MGEDLVARGRRVGYGDGRLHGVYVALRVAHPHDKVVQPTGDEAPREDHIRLAYLVVQGTG